MMAHIPGFPATPGEPTLLMSWLDPYSQCVGCYEARKVKRLEVLSGHFGLLGGRNGRV
jgi:hypothetical protein